MKRLRTTVTLLLAATVLAGCSSSKKIDTNTASGAFQLAQKYEKDERYDEAISSYSDVKNKFPYSRFAVEAQLKIADLQFKQENYVEAESAYRLFKEFHPNYAKTDYVTYRIGLSVYKQLPPTTDRDLTLAKTAIDSFNIVITNYPGSSYAKDATSYAAKCKLMLAQKDKYIADYYFGQEKWESALGRYEDLIRDYPDQGYQVQALYGATVSAYKMKDMERAKTYFKELLEEFPNSSQLMKARKELADGFCTRTRTFRHG